jgi:hypothetical protein
MAIVVASMPMKEQASVPEQAFAPMYQIVVPMALLKGPRATGGLTHARRLLDGYRRRR